MDIRAELQELMTKKNYSMAFVSTATGIAKSTVSMWLNKTYKGDNAKIADKINKLFIILFLLSQDVAVIVLASETRSRSFCFR